MYKHPFMKPPAYKSLNTNTVELKKEPVPVPEKKDPVPEKKKEKQSLMFRYNWFSD